MITVLCADKKCKQKSECVRFTVDPATALSADHRVRVESSLHDIGLEECKKFIQLKEVKYEVNC